jgi:hypothetical protein
MKALYWSPLSTITALAPRKDSLRPTLSKLKRPASFIVAVLVAALSPVAIPRAMAQTIYEGTPNGGFFSFTLAPGASTGPIQLPSNVPWHISGVVTTADNEGVGEVEIMLGNVSGEPFLEWIGLNSWEAGTITSGVSSSAARIVEISFQGDVLLAASSTTNSFVVTNTSTTVTNTGYVTWTGLGMAILAPSNTAVGTSALQSYILNNYSATGTNNTAAGYQALYSDTGAGSQGSDNTGAGANALYSNTTGSYNTASGVEALYSNSSGEYNTASGFQALYHNVHGSYNTASGDGAMFDNTSGGDNTAYGVNALYENHNGSFNTAVGLDALRFNTSGSSNIVIGYKAGMNLSTGSNNIEIGSPGLAAESGVIRIGTITGTTSTQSATYIAGISGEPVIGTYVCVNSDGQLGTNGSGCATTSSRRYKEDIQPMAQLSERLLKLRPVTFRYRTPDADGHKSIQYGLIAEEVAEVFPELVVFNKDGQPDAVKYQVLTPMLLNEVQQQAAEIRELKEQQAQQLSGMQQQLADMHAALVKLQAKDELVAQR